MRRREYTRAGVFAVRTSISAIAAAGAVAVKMLRGGIPRGRFALIEGPAAPGAPAMLAETLAPEACERRGADAGPSTPP